ncbi:nucleic acid-binding protein [Rhizobium grahamii CCGE 502]|uniref:Nucleic acid-binding protein n=1 Tax=Rhizobium grahamii CCGE 502 TaxID=990285 RepID=S3IBE1_9HYPH|nr:nucleic acid-binding protein [Rhizobium grahamii CCGE 502]
MAVDTSIWIDHFRYDDADRRKIIEDDRLLCYPFIVGEWLQGVCQNEMPLSRSSHLNAKP